MSIKRVLFIVLVASGVMLAVGIGLGFTNSARALPAQSLAAASAASGGGPIGDTFTVTVESLEEVYPAVAYNPDREEYLVVWYNDRAGNDDIRAQRVSKDGTLVGSAFYVAAGSGADRYFPDVAYNGDDQEYLVVWQEFNHTSTNTTIRGMRVSGTGSLLTGAFDIFTGDPSQLPAVAYASTAHEYLVVCEYFDLSGYHIMYRTYSTSTGLGTTDYVYQDPGGSDGHNPDLAYNRARNEFLVVWRQKAGSDYDIYGQRVKMAGGVGLQGSSFVIINFVGDDLYPAVAAIPKPSGTGQYMVVGERYTNIYAQLVSGVKDGGDSGTQLIGNIFDISATPDDETHPAVAGSESNQQYLVVWRHDDYAAPFIFDGIAGWNVASDGSLLGNEKTVIGGIDADNAAVAAGPLGDFLVVFDDPPLGGGDKDIYGRLWGNRIYLPLVMRNH